MSSSIFPDSHTRKEYGQVGRILKRQRKNFMSELEKMKNDHHKSHEQQMKEQRESYDLRIKNLKRLFLVVAISALILIIVLIIN